MISQAHKKLINHGLDAGIIQSGHPKNYHLLAQVASIQTIGRRQSLPFMDRSQDVLIVIDEAHHVQDDNTYGALLVKYPHAKVLMVTATPYRLSGKGFLNVFPGKETHLIINSTTKKLIEDGWLVPIKYCIGSIPDLSAVQIVKGEYNEEQAALIMGQAPIIKSYRDHCDGMQGIAFCINVKHSIDVCQLYNNAGIKAAHIDGTTPDYIRAELIEQYRQGIIRVMTNVNIFTEGTDLPVCQFVQLVAPSKSLSRVLQAIGRITRAEAGLVDRFYTQEERIAAIAASSKPFGKVLDNTGAWREHGFPDEDHDWPKYFRGWKKDKPAPSDQNMIEIPIYEIEDPATGARRTTKNIKELEGMILVEVTKEIRESVKRLQYMDQFYKLYAVAKNAKNITEKGQWAYFSFKEFCEKRNIEITNQMWLSLKKVLVDDIDHKVKEICDGWRLSGIRRIAGDSPEIAAARRMGMREGFLREEMLKYKRAKMERA